MKHGGWMNKPRADMTPEELEQARAYGREWQRKLRAKRTPEQRDAVRDYMRAYYADRKNRVRKTEGSKTSYQTVKGRAGRLLSSARCRAAKTGVPCTLTIAWVQEQIERGTCARTGLAFDLATPRPGERKNPLAPSLDRIEAGGPYSPENCEVTTSMFNFWKNEWGYGEMARHAEAFLLTATTNHTTKQPTTAKET